MSTPETNLSAAGRPVADTPSSSAMRRRASLLNTLILLIRREFWEHRALWIAPVVVAGLLIAGALAATFHYNPASIDWDAPDPGLTHDEFAQHSFVKEMGMQRAINIPLYLVLVAVLTFYLLDCLYVERKDRSILFWKSLPVSDATTVASKLLVALVVAPIGVYLLTVVSSILLSIILGVRLSFAHLPPNSFIWDTVIWLKVQVLCLFSLIASLLWYAPLASYLVLVSAWARRNVFLWAILPPAIGMLLERMVFGTHYLAELIKYRTVNVPGRFSLNHAIHSAVAHAHDSSMSLQADLSDIGQVLLNIDLWLGLAAAVAFAFVAARIRRYRDDT
jgi:ABC-2 type transport system permease protein